MGSVYKLSTEFPRDHGGGVQALAALSDNVLVSGANDGTVCVWARGSDGRSFANVHLSVSDHAGMIRAVFALPACGLCPEGGFATGCLDKLVRVFTYSPSTHAVACVATLAGHTGGVDSLGLTSQGHLLSGGRDGQARVWDLATGACLQAMAGHENSVRVCGLVGGAIVTSSTGRKSEEGLHVDYKLRLWKCTSGVGGKPAWALERTIEDHTQAIQDLGGMPGGEGFVSSGNDGTLRVRDAQGNPLQCITVPPTPTGEPVYVYKGRLLPATMWLAGCCEDSMLRLWCMDTLPATADAIALPGTPWGVVGLGNGDIAVSCTHAASGTIGHVYIFTQDAARGASQAELATFAADLVPPARSSEGSSSSSSSSSGAQKVHISGPYSARQSTPPGATALGGYGFFRMPSGGIWVSTWSGTAWDDVGEAQGLEGDDGWAGGGGGGDSGGFDYSQNVEIELQSGMAKVPLRWNDGDDLDDVAEAFCKANGVPMRNSGQVRTFMVQTMAQQGVGPGGRKKEAEALAAAAAAAARPPTLAARLGLTLIPSMAYVETSAVDWKKVSACVCGGGGHTAHTRPAPPTPPPCSHSPSPPPPSLSPSFWPSSLSSMPQWAQLAAALSLQRRRPGCGMLLPPWRTPPATTPPGSPQPPWQRSMPRCCTGPCPTCSLPWTFCACASRTPVAQRPALPCQPSCQPCCACALALGRGSAQPPCWQRARCTMPARPRPRGGPCCRPQGRSLAPPCQLWQPCCASRTPAWQWGAAWCCTMWRGRWWMGPRPQSRQWLLCWGCWGLPWGGRGGRRTCASMPCWRWARCCAAMQRGAGCGWEQRRLLAWRAAWLPSCRARQRLPPERCSGSCSCSEGRLSSE